MAVVFPYVKNTTWADGSAGGTPTALAFTLERFDPAGDSNRQGAPKGAPCLT